MAKKKVVIKVSMPMDNKRCAKAYKAMAAFSGYKITIEGANQDLIVICAERIDAAGITMLLRRKFDTSCMIESVSNVEPPKKEEKKEVKKEEKKEEKKGDDPKPYVHHFPHPNYIPGGFNGPNPPFNVPFNQHHGNWNCHWEPDQQSGCSIM